MITTISVTFIQTLDFVVLSLDKSHKTGGYENRNDTRMRGFAVYHEIVPMENLVSSRLNVQSIHAINFRRSVIIYYIKYTSCDRFFFENIKLRRQWYAVFVSHPLDTYIRDRLRCIDIIVISIFFFSKLYFRVVSGKRLVFTVFICYIRRRDDGRMKNWGKVVFRKSMDYERVYTRPRRTGFVTDVYRGDDNVRRNDVTTEISDENDR